MQEDREDSARIALRIHDPAPDFSARSTSGPVSLSDYRGQWLMLFSHPADFTSVCTSELIAFARTNERFERLNCRLLGLSVDSLHAHIAWLQDIETRFGVRVTFPLIEDSGLAISRAYGMLDSKATNSATVRATYIIDPAGIIRAIVWYPMNVGRSVEELIRLVEALQASEQQQALAPEGWRPGESLVEPAAASLEEALKLEPESAWYFRKRDG